jgi:hypothetical protein
VNIPKSLIESVLVNKGLAKFAIMDQYVGFPGEGYNFSFTDVEFHTVSSSLDLYRVNVRLQ